MGYERATVKEAPFDTYSVDFVKLVDKFESIPLPERGSILPGAGMQLRNSLSNHFLLEGNKHGKSANNRMWGVKHAFWID